MSNGKIDEVALLDVIRPPQGYKTAAAWLGAYSVDLVAVVACLIAMAGEDSDGDMPPTAVATAITRLTGQVRVVAQAGRISLPKNGRNTLRMADRWIREVHVDGNHASWHPKLALVRQTGAGPDRWVLWLGSRNLTRDVSWDLGLALTGVVHDAPEPLPGLETVARTLATHAELPGWASDDLAAALAHVHWFKGEDALVVEALSLHHDGHPSTLPECPEDATRLLALSPFVDRTTLKQFRRWGPPGATRRLATTTHTLHELARGGVDIFDGLELYTMEASSHEPIDTDDDVEHFEEPHRGLHAKALLAYTPAAERGQLWLGSANLTRRAWLRAVNVELTARVDLATDLADQLWEFTQSSLFCSEHPNLKDLEGTEVTPACPIDALRNRIAAYKPAPILRVDGTHLALRFAEPLPHDTACAVTVGLMGGKQVKWARGEDLVTLPLPGLRDWTELLHLTLRHTDTTEHMLLRGTWLGGIPDQRDHHAISQLLGARAFLRWLVASLHGVPIVDGGSWPPRTGHSGASGVKPIHTSLDLIVPSLEAILRTWIRHPERLRTIDRRVQELLHHVRAAEEDAEEPDTDALAELKRFEAQWAVLRQGLWEAE